MSNARRESTPILLREKRLHNKRVRGGLLADGTILWSFKRLTDSRTIEGHRIRLSKEALIAMLEIAAVLEYEVRKTP